MMERLNVRLDWFANTNHTGFLLAQKRGWFSKEGLEVIIDGHVHGTMTMEDDLDFVCGPQVAMMKCMEQGVKMTAVAVMNQKCDSGIVSLKEAGITRPRDLEGKRLTHWDPDWYHKTIGRLVENDGGDYSKVKLIQMDVGDIVSTLGNIADATWVYENWENYVLKEAGKEINYFNLGDFDPIFNFCAPAMAASRKILEERPEAVKKFLGILDRAYREVCADPELVLEVKDMMPEGCSDEMLVASQRHLAEIMLDDKGRWGRIYPERWNPMAEYLVEVGVISKRFENEYTTEYFPE